MDTKYGWLIENGKKGDALRYRNMEQGIPTWTADHDEALRFSRRKDAEKFAAEDEDAWRIVEHIFDDGIPQHPQPTCCGYCDYDEADGSLIDQCQKCKTHNVK